MLKEEKERKVKITIEEYSQSLFQRGVFSFYYSSNYSILKYTIFEK